MDYEKNAKASAKAFNKWHKQNRYVDRENARRAWSAGVNYGIKNQPLSEIPQSFNDWWNAENLTQDNPFAANTPAFWAWEGWQASLATIAAESAPAAPEAKQKPVVRLQEYTSDRPFSAGQKFFEMVMLDRDKCRDGLELYAAPVANAGQAQAVAVPDELRDEIAKLTWWKHCMSYNDSYFGEPAGLVKRVAYQLDRLLAATPLPQQVAQEGAGNPASKFQIGAHVRKTKGSQWSSKVVGTYSTALTPEGYAVESSTEHGSVQIYPASALELILNEAAK